jgi:hypothetical protein
MPDSSCPFEKGKHYRILQDISHLNHHLMKGSDVIFKAYGYDFKFGVKRYWFDNTENAESNAWHVFDSAPEELQLWQNYFSEIK